MKKNREKPVKTVGERLTDMLDMPSDIVLDIPKVTVMSDNSLTVENYIGILEYTEEKIRIKTKEKIIVVDGSCLVICVITDSYILIEGRIKNVRWD